MAKTRRATRKGSRKASRKTQSGGKRKASAWTRAVTELYKKMRKEDPNVKFGAALRKASELKKKGQLY